MLVARGKGDGGRWRGTKGGRGAEMETVRDTACDDGRKMQYAGNVLLSYILETCIVL